MALLSKVSRSTSRYCQESVSGGISAGLGVSATDFKQEHVASYAAFEQQASEPQDYVAIASAHFDEDRPMYQAI